MKKIFFAIAIIFVALNCIGQELNPIKPYKGIDANEQSIDSIPQIQIVNVPSDITYLDSTSQQVVENLKNSISKKQDDDLFFELGIAMIKHSEMMMARQKAKIGLEKLEYGDWGFYIGDYHFTEYEDIWGDNDLGYNEESYMQEFSNSIHISKSECDALVSALNKKKNCNKNIYYTFKSEGYGENCIIKVFVTYRDKKKEYEAEKKTRMKTIK